MNEEKEEVIAEKTSVTKTAKSSVQHKEPLFYLYKDGNGHEIRVANMKNTIICPRNKVIEIESTQKSNFHETRFSTSVAYDAELDIYFGVPVGIDTRTKGVIWKRFILNERNTYDLSIQNQAIEWAVVSRASFVEGSLYQKGKVKFKIYDREKEAKDVVHKLSLRRQADKIISEMVTIEEQMDMFRNFGRNPQGFTPTMLYAELIKIAERNPKEFLDHWHNKNKDVITIFHRSIAVGIISFHTSEGGYLWKGSRFMGATEQEAINFLADDKNILNQAKIESKQKDIDVRKMSDAEKAFYKVDEAEAEDPALVERRSIAKIMKIQGYNSMSIEELDAAIELAEKN